MAFALISAIALLPLLKEANEIQANEKKYTCKDFSWWQYLLILLWLIFIVFAASLPK